jgi:UPF0716 protein FxsA
MATGRTALGATGYPRRRAGSRWRAAIGLGALAEVVVFVLVAGQLGVAWTILLTLGTSALGAALLARQGTRALGELRERMKDPAAPHPSQARGGTLQRNHRALGDAGLTALGALLLVLPGFLGDLLGLLCVLPGTRRLPRALIARGIAGRMPDRWLGPVRVRATRAEPVDGTRSAGPAASGGHRVIEGEIAS